METMYIDSLREWRSGVVVNRGGLWRYRLATCSCRRYITKTSTPFPEGESQQTIKQSTTQQYGTLNGS
jgi:hypothetical protein